MEMDTDNMFFKSKCAALWRQWLVYFFILLAYIFWATLLQDNQLLCLRSLTVWSKDYPTVI